MLRSKYRKRRNKKGGRSFMEAFAQGSGDLKNMAKKTTFEVQQKVGEAQRQAEVFRRAHEQELTKTGMDAGAFNPFKKKEDPFKRNPKILGQSITLNPLNTAVQREKNRRKMAYTNEAKRLDGVITGTYTGGKRKKRKTRKKRKMRKRKTRKRRKMRKRKTRRKRRR